eukprot:2614123-Amphidinium_carterae.1
MAGIEMVHYRDSNRQWHDDLCLRFRNSCVTLGTFAGEKLPVQNGSFGKPGSCFRPIKLQDNLQPKERWTNVVCLGMMTSQHIDAGSGGTNLAADWFAS